MRLYADIKQRIEQEFGPMTGEKPDEFTEENAAMEAFIEERIRRIVLGSRQPVWNYLRHHAETTGGNGYLCLTGEAGSGKSALLGKFCQDSFQEEIARDRSSLAALAEANELKGDWEVAETIFHRLLVMGAPLQKCAPRTINCALNAHEKLLPGDAARIESLLGQLEAAGHAALAAPLRKQFNAKRSPAKKPSGRFGGIAFPKNLNEPISHLSKQACRHHGCEYRIKVRDKSERPRRNVVGKS
jgi:hypothetical protein